MLKKQIIPVLMFLCLAVVFLSSCGKQESLQYTLINDHYELTSYDSEENEPVICIPEQYKDKPVTAVAEHCFSRCTALKEIIIPDSVTSIGSAAFYGCTSLESVRLPESLTLICDNLFNGCSSLKDITLPNGILEIEDYAFVGCASLKQLLLPEGLRSIGKGAFEGCGFSILDIRLPDTVQNIGPVICGDYEITVTNGMASAALMNTADRIEPPVEIIGFPVAKLCVGHLNCTNVKSFCIPQKLDLDTREVSWKMFEGGNTWNSAISVLDCCESLSFTDLLPDSLENAAKVSDKAELPEWNRVMPLYIYDDVSDVHSLKDCTSRANGYLFSQLPKEIRSESGFDADCVILSVFAYEDRNEYMIFNGVDVSTKVYLYYPDSGALYEVLYHRDSPNVGDPAGSTGDTLTGEEVWEKIAYLFE